MPPTPEEEFDAQPVQNTLNVFSSEPELTREQYIRSLAASSAALAFSGTNQPINHYVLDLAASLYNYIESGS